MNTQTLSIAEPSPFDANAFASHTLSSAATLAAVLDHTLLKPEATPVLIARAACATASIPDPQSRLIVAAETLAGTGVPVGVVIGFPLGATLSASKRDEAARVLKLGAHDVDMVLNIGFLKSGTKEDFDALKQDIRGVVELAHGAGGIVKVILETCLLTFEEKLRASELALAAGADFIKTSTGFSSGGATVDDITLMRSVAGTRAGVKASGGIRSLADASAMLHAGASRSVKILAELAGHAPAPTALIRKA